MFYHQSDQLKALFSAIVQQNIRPEAWAWINEKCISVNNLSSLNTAFVAMPGKTGKSIIHLTAEQVKQLQSIYAAISIHSWPADRLCRVWLLMQVDPSDKAKYFAAIENLFLAAEVQELVALYTSLPFLAYPEMWVMRCAEGVRSNIADVLHAVMCDNPYPAEYLDDAAWNQLVLKAFFTEKPVNKIIGLDKRTNQPLADILSDYAHERWAARRTVNPQLWRCVGRYINEHIFPDIQRIAGSENMMETAAAALACYDSNYAPAKELLGKLSTFNTAIASGELTWDILAENIKISA
jgi:muconolactone delta-isomerase